MYQINLSITPEGMTQCDLNTPRDKAKEAEEFFSFLRPHIRVLHQLATEFKADKEAKDQEASNA